MTVADESRRQPMGDRMNARSRVSAILIVAGMTLLTGCGQAGSAPEDAGEQASGADPDYATTMVACLAGDGWDAEVAPGNSFTIELPEEQAEPFQESVSACQAEYGYDEQLDLNGAQLRELYQGLAEMAHCIENEGYAITEFPTEQSFLEDRFFDPYGELRDPRNPHRISDEEYESLLEKCPMP